MVGRQKGIEESIESEESSQRRLEEGSITQSDFSRKAIDFINYMTESEPRERFDVTVRKNGAFYKLSEVHGMRVMEYIPDYQI